MSNPTNGNGATAQKALTEQALENSIQKVPPANATGGPSAFIFRLARQAEEFVPWFQVRKHDEQIFDLWHSESVLAGAMAVVATEYSNRNYTISGSTRAVNYSTNLLESADMGAGFVSLLLKTAQDVKGRTNGAFWGLPREDYISGEEALKRTAQRRPMPRVTSIEHLDATACWRTGNPLYPVIYRDPDGGAPKRLPWHMVVPFAELPSPVKQHRGIQFCAVSRVLYSAKAMRDRMIYKDEKITGRGGERVHIIGGVKGQEIRDAFGIQDERADNKNLLRWMEDYIITSLNPEVTPSAITLELKSDGGFGDIEKEFTIYVTILALDFLETFTTFAPLQSGNLGNSEQTEILSEGAEGRGPKLFQKMISQALYQHGIIPRNASFMWDDQSNRAAKDRWELINLQLDAIDKVLANQTVTVPVAQQIMVDEGILLTDETLALLGQADQTPDITVEDDQPTTPTDDIRPIEPAPLEAVAKSLKAMRIEFHRLRRARKDAEAEGIVAAFSETAHNAVAEYVDGLVSKRQAEAAFMRAIDSAWPAMAEAAYEAGGGDWAEVDEEDFHYLENALSEQTDFAARYWDALKDVRAEGDPIPEDRTELYVNSLRGLFAQFKGLGAGNPMLTFVLGDAEEHCQDKDGKPGCLDLNGKRYSLKKWLKMGVLPGTPGSETVCGGFHCKCRWEDDEGNVFAYDKQLHRRRG